MYKIYQFVEYKSIAALPVSWVKDGLAPFNANAGQFVASGNRALQKRKVFKVIALDDKVYDNNKSAMRAKIKLSEKTDIETSDHEYIEAEETSVLTPTKRKSSFKTCSYVGNPLSDESNEGVSIPITPAVPVKRMKSCHSADTFPESFTTSLEISSVPLTTTENSFTEDSELQSIIASTCHPNDAPVPIVNTAVRDIPISVTVERRTLGYRHIQCLLLFSSGLIAYWSRVNVSVAIVVMPIPVHPDIDVNSFILSSFYWGYTIAQLPSGQLGQRYGTKIMLFITIFIPSVLTLLTPICFDYGGWIALCVLRVLEGLTSGGIFPLFHTHLSNWSPMEERNCMGGFAYSGVEIGTVFAFITSGLIADTNFGWPGIFYIPGIIGLLWCVLWYFFGINSPEEAQSISSSEKKYILSSSSTSKDSSKAPVPWKSIVTSLPFIALIIVRISHSWGFSTLLQETPLYLDGVMALDIRSNAVYSALPYLVMWILGYVFLLLAEIFSKTECISLTVIRKTFNSISQWGPALALIWLAFSKADNLPLAITLLTLAISLGSASTLGSVLNHIDLAPKNSGILMGIANTAANLISIIVPLVVGAIVYDTTDQSQWKIVFLIAAGVYLIGNLIYVIFGQMTKQSWDDVTSSNQNGSRRSSIFMEIPPHILSLK